MTGAGTQWWGGLETHKAAEGTQVHPGPGQGCHVWDPHHGERMTMRKPRLVLGGQPGTKHPVVPFSGQSPTRTQEPRTAPGTLLGHLRRGGSTGGCSQFSKPLYWRPQLHLKLESAPVARGPFLVPGLQAVGVAQRCSGDNQTPQVEATVRGAPRVQGVGAQVRGRASSQRVRRPWGSAALPLLLRKFWFPQWARSTSCHTRVIQDSSGGPDTSPAAASPEASPPGSLALAHVVRQASPARRNAAGQG